MSKAGKEGPFYTAKEAATRLGVSAKALRIYEQRGLLDPTRTEAGWRVYGQREMTRGAEIAALRALGLSLTQIAGVLDQEPESLASALAVQQGKLEGEAAAIASRLARVRELRTALANGASASAAQLVSLARPTSTPMVSLTLPWPWGGERFDLPTLTPMTYIVGPLFSGKTTLAQLIAETLPQSEFLPMARIEKNLAALETELGADPALRERVSAAVQWLEEDGATPSLALTVILMALLKDGPAAVVVDLLEHDLDADTQSALRAWLRQRGKDARTLVATTRSTAILDLEDVSLDETILFCPPNHDMPFKVEPWPGAPGYEAVGTCLATPDVRERTAGVTAVHPSAL